MKRIPALAIVLFALFAAAPLAAPVESSFVYRGTLSDVAGPVDGRYDLQLVVYADAGSRQRVAGPIELSDVAVRDGAFSVPLDLALANAAVDEVWIAASAKRSDEPAFAAPGAPMSVKLATGAACWETTGNAGTLPTTNFLGTTDGRALRLSAAGGIGVNTTAPEPTTAMTVRGGSFTGGTLWLESTKGPNVSHTHFGAGGDWFLRSATNTGKVVLQDTARESQVAIGTSSPQAGTKLYVQDGASGAPAGQAPTVKIESTDTASLHFVSGGTNSGLMQFRNAAGASVIVGAGGDSFADNTFSLLLGGADIYRFSRSGLAIFRFTTANALEVEGSASKLSAGDWLANSDRRIKTAIEPIANALDTLARLRPVTFRYTPEYLAQHPKIADHRYYNVVAQEFAEVFPDYVQDSGEKTAAGEGILQVDTHPIGLVTAAAVQELHREPIARDELAARDAARIAALEARIDRLERLLARDRR